MLMQVNDRSEEALGVSYEDLKDYASEWFDAEETRRWIENQLLLVLPPGSRTFVGPYEISRHGGGLELRRRT